MDTLEIIQTTKQKSSAIYEGHQYRQHRTKKENVISWLCINEKTAKCRGCLKSKDGIVLQVSNHVCKPDIATTEVKKHLSNVRKRIREEDQHISKIYQEELNPLLNRGYDIVANIPLLSSVKSQLHRIRRNAQGQTKEPTTAEEINIPEDILLMEDGSNFLLADEVREYGILVFASQQGREIFRKCKTFFADGTFRSCSKQFCQLYTVHADLGSTAEETNIVPAAYALLSKKNQRTYEKLFAILKCKTGWSPQSVTMDFEQAAIVALKLVFPSVDITGCNFHFNQCLWRRVQGLGLASEYRDDAEIRLHVRMCAALAYLPVEDVDDGWLSIQEDSPEHPKLQQFYDYFVEQWLENGVVTTNMWNCHNKRHRTNNAVEGWNNKLNSLISTPHPKIKALILSLKDDSQYIAFLSQRADLCLEGKKRAKKYIKLDDRISRVLSYYETAKDIKMCLKSLAYIARLE